MNVNIFEKANQIIRGCDAAYFGVIDEDGYPSVSTVEPIRQKNIFEAYIASGLTGNKAKRLMKNNRASVCYRAGDSNVTLVGEAEILVDQKTKSSYWHDGLFKHFPLGETDPNYCVVKFSAKRISLWIDYEDADFTIRELLAVQSRCGLLCGGCTYREAYNCGGCVETNGHPFHGECPIAACCQDKGYVRCGQCGVMPCDKLHEYSCLDSEHGDKPQGARLEICRAWREMN